MSIIEILLFGLVIIIAHFLEAITGFGCTVLALPFCIAITGVKITVPVLTVIGWLLALYIIIIDWKSIIFKEYLKILGFVILGLPIGMRIFDVLPETPLKILLGIFMLIVSIRGLIISFMPEKDNVSPNHGSKVGKWLLNFCLFCGGVIHGAFSSGGPFIIIYATKALPNKSNFRVTLSALWITLNSVVIIKNFMIGIMTKEVINLTIWMIPFLIVGMVLGNMAHKRIDGSSFNKIVYGALLISGIFMFV
ncbi:sulfite exporter TauE/SafE family protein [Maledivibacter halophilus]|uniref:Probable membrane transporter protein n=1 Tax=Maledivibacter halophilus TaxID=36842 RepID=A0A1T5MMH0_9FIRM|nr:sulfite exporter TauE/SafE family protein [Maledivibacter halophilus]SKC89411.1 hypothetical protein SAMN02194393_05031 [Maledivibacter halophilus]